jgi:hypothetical protein
MADTQTTAGAAIAVTARYDFHNATPNGDKLFSVREGVPLGDSFDQLSLLIASAHSAIDGMSKEGEDAAPNARTAALHVLDISYALAQSMHAGLVVSQS